MVVNHHVNIVGPVAKVQQGRAVVHRWTQGHET